MGNAIRKQKLSLRDHLLQNPRSYSFEMAARILGHNSEEEYGKEISVQKFPFRTISINSFHLRGTEIEKIIEKNDQKLIFIERLSLAGLNAPLPTPYAELIYNRNVEKDYALGRFLNTFNARILGISYLISKRKYECLQADAEQKLSKNNFHDRVLAPDGNLNTDSSDSHSVNDIVVNDCGNYVLLNSVTNFIGGNHHDIRLARLSYLFWIKEKSAVGLETVIKYLFGFRVFVEQLVPVRLPINDDNRLCHVHLGKDSGLGTHCVVTNLGIRIHLFSDDFRTVFDMLTVKNRSEELNRVIRKYIGDFLQFTVLIRPKQVPPLTLGRAFLGKTSWIPGKRPDAATV